MYPISRHVSAPRMAGVHESFANSVEQLTHQLSRLDAEIDPAAEPRRGDAFHQQVLATFQESQLACREFEDHCGDDRSLLLDAQTRFRLATAPWFDRSWIAHRSRSKPSGFPGDFEMLIKLYQEATPARGLGGYLDLCILDLPLARAVRSRMRAVREFLLDETERRGRDVRVLDIACGPCFEYLDWPARGGNQKIAITAMDNDPAALACVEANVASQVGRNMCLRPIRYNAIRTRSAQATTRKFGKFDIIYSVGLCDYLPDDMLIAMLSAWRQVLDPGGVLYVAFKDARRYDKTPYQWHLDWFFYQRTLKECLSLYERSGFEIDALEATRDSTGIIMSFVSRTVRDRVLRLDLPQDVLANTGEVSPPVTNPAPLNG